ncbi:MAG: RNA-guided endonuclease InsQ/TnpB family protein [Candidatus Hermodarchaeota archaeon]
MQLTIKRQIYPTKDQQEVLWDLADICRRVYNLALFERQYVYEQYGARIRYTDQQNALPLLKQVFPEFKQVYSKTLQMVLRRLDNNFKSFFALRRERDSSARPPRYRASHFFFTLTYNQSGFKVNQEQLTLSHKHLRNVNLTFTTNINLASLVIRQIELTYDALRGKYYLCITHEEVTPEYQNNGHYQAFDLGINDNVGVNTYGKFLVSKVKRPDKYWEPRLTSLQSRIDHCKRGSRRQRRLQQLLRAHRHKPCNQTLDWQHKQAMKLVANTRANTLIVGELNPKAMAQKNNNYSPSPQLNALHRGVHNTGHLGRFVQMLTYKAQRVGKVVTAIDEGYTSKLCCVCGHTQEMPLYKRVFRCEQAQCTHTLDRDQNAAINLLLRYFILHNLPHLYHIFRASLYKTQGLLVLAYAPYRQVTLALRPKSQCPQKLPVAQQVQSGSHAMPGGQARSGRRCFRQQNTSPSLLDCDNFLTANRKTKVSSTRG